MERRDRIMKREYKKPMVVFEDFSLSANIAAGCEVQLKIPFDGLCGYQPEGYDKYIFITGVAGCQETHDNGYGYNALCYHVPNTANNLFNS